jgi:hypothetical protein
MKHMLRQFHYLELIYFVYVSRLAYCCCGIDLRVDSALTFGIVPMAGSEAVMMLVYQTASVIGQGTFARRSGWWVRHR